MRVSRSAILIILGILTIFFLGSSYALWFNDDLIPFTLHSSEPPTPMAAATAGVEGNLPKAVRLTIKETGIVAVTAQQLKRAGLTFGELSNEVFRLTRNNREVPFLVVGDGDSATLYFFGQATTNSREPLSVYVLGLGKGVPMSKRDASPQGPGTQTGYHNYKWEENRFFVGHAGGDDVWMGPLLMAPDKWTYRLEDIQAVAAPAELTIHLFSNRDGPADPDHHVVVQINDRNVAEHSWDGIKHEIIVIPLAEGVLTDDENNISLLLQDNSDIPAETIYVNEFELTYQGPLSAANGRVSFTSDAANLLITDVETDLMVFDITDHSAPIHLTNVQLDNGTAHFAGSGARSEYIAVDQSQSVQVDIEIMPDWVDSLRDTKWGADYIAIVADVEGFDQAIDPLLNYRQSQGMRVLSVPLEQIYDEFGAGHKSPAAIKTFLAYTAAHWTPPAPHYVLLVGDATYDATDQVTGKNRNRLPTPLIHTIVGGFVASDAWFGRFTVGLSPMVVGRFPAQNTPQLRSMVEKTLAYEQNMDNEDNSWRNQALLVADDEPIFDEATVDFANKLIFNGFRVYRLQMSHSERIHYNIISAINQGVGLINYFGQGSNGTWGDEVVFQNSDAQSLYNGSKLPIFTSFTTQNGAFADPQLDALGESLLRANNGGVVAAIAPSGTANVEQLLRLSDQFYEKLLSQDSSRLGDVLTDLGTIETSDPSWADALVALNLLGDPALQYYKP